MPEKNTVPLLSPKFALALQFANEIHSTQARKGLGAPYISHLMAVSALVLEFGGDEEHAIGALLHDAAEDCGGHAMLETVRTLFGERVAMIVEGCTDTFDDPKPDWESRKQTYLAHLKEASDDIKLVAAADKLHNLTCTFRDIQEKGLDIFAKFSKGLEDQLWYYRGCLTALSAKSKALPIIPVFEDQLLRFEKLVDRLSKDGAPPSSQAYDADAEISKEIAKVASNHVCERAKRKLMKMPASGLAGDDANLRNVWEEICVQLQYEESIDWEAYEITVRQVVEGTLLNCADHEKLAIWLQSDAGLDWRYGDDYERESRPYIDDSELASYIQREFLYPMAEHWSNSRIRDFVDRDFEFEGLETAGEIVDDIKAAIPSSQENPATNPETVPVTDAPPNNTYQVMVDDNFHYMDTDERWTLGSYETLDDAVAACKQLVDECLSEYFQPGITAEELYSQYTSFGDDPFIIGGTQRIPFSAWDYAKQRCVEIAGTTPA